MQYFSNQEAHISLQKYRVLAETQMQFISQIWIIFEGLMQKLNFKNILAQKGATRVN